MTILVTGATGMIGSQVIKHLRSRGYGARALVRDPAKATLLEGVEVVKGDMLDVDSMRAAMRGVRTLFLLNAVVPDEFTQAMIALNLAREAGIERIVYFSVLHSDTYVDVPHFAGKHAIERMIEQTDLKAGILRPAYFINNDMSVKDTILDGGAYPMPVGETGLAMVDARDIAEVAAIELLRRNQAAVPIQREVIEIVGPELLTGTAIAGIWSEVLGRPVEYVGGDLARFELTMRSSWPSWAALDMRIMAQRFQSEGMLGGDGAVERLTKMLGRPLRSYRDFAAEVAGG